MFGSRQREGGIGPRADKVAGGPGAGEGLWPHPGAVQQVQDGRSTEGDEHRRARAVTDTPRVPARGR